MHHRSPAVVLALLVLAVGLACAEPPPIVQATYRASLGDTALRVTATLQVMPPQHAAASVRLLPTSFPLTGPLPRGDAARVVMRRGAYWLEVAPAPAAAKPIELTLAFRSPVAKRREHRTCRLPIVPALRVVADLPQELYDLRATPPVPIEAKGGRLLLYAPARREIELRWQGTPPAAALAPVFRVDADANVSTAMTSLTATTELSVQVLQGELRTLKIALPEGGQLRSVSGKPVGRWELRGGTVTVEFRSPVRARATLSLQVEQLAEGEGQFVWWPVRVEGAQHQGGRAYFRAAPGLLLRAADKKGFERVSDGYAPDAAAGRQTLVLAYPRLPASIRLAVERFEPRVTAAVAMLAQLERGVVTQRATLDYTIHDAGVRQFQVRVGKGADVLEVVCKGLLDHDVAEGVLTVRLRDAVKGKAQLKLVIQRPIERLDGVVIPRLLAIGVARQTGLVGVAAAANVELRHQRAVEAEQVDVRLLPTWVRKLGSPKLAYRTYDRPNSLVAVETAPLLAEFDVLAAETCVLNDDGWARQVTWRCSVRRGEVFAWRVRVPEGVLPLEVACHETTRVKGKKLRRPSPVLKDWEFDDKARLLKVMLARGLKGDARLVARFGQRVPDASAPQTLRGIALDGSRRLTGSVVVQARVPVALRAAKMTGLEALRGRVGQLAFGIEATDWQLDLAATPIKPVIAVRASTVLGVRPGQVAADAMLDFAIQKAPVNTLTLSLPEGAVNSSVTGADIKSSRLDGPVWTIRLARKVQGRYRLRVTYDHVIPAEGGACDCATIDTPGVARHEGLVAVARDSDRIEVAVEQPQGLFETDPADVPRRGGPNRAVLAAYRYTGQGSLRARIDVLGRAQVLQAKALGAIVETMLKEDGQTLTQLTYDIRNANRQFLRIELPADAALLGAYVNGEPVSSATGPDGATLVPLLAGQQATRGNRGGDNVLEVVVIYGQRHEPLAGGRRLALASPKVDVRTEALSWAVYLPPGYRAQRTKGNMRLIFRPPSDRTLSLVFGMFAAEFRAAAAAVRVADRMAAAMFRAWRRYAPLLFLGLCVLVAGCVAVWVIRRTRRWMVALEQRGGMWVKRAAPRHWVPATAGCLLMFLTLIVFAAMLLPSLGRASKDARRVHARSNLRQIGAAMAIYRNEHGDNRFYPSSTRSLVESGVLTDGDALRDPSTGKRFVYLHEGKHVPADHPPNKPMGYMESQGGVNVLFFDSHVEFHRYGDDRLATLIPNRDFQFPPDENVDAPEAAGEMAQMELQEQPVFEDESRLEQLDKELRNKKLDYGQQKLLRNIRGRASRRQQARASLAKPAPKPKPSRPKRPAPSVEEPPTAKPEGPGDKKPVKAPTTPAPPGDVVGGQWYSGGKVFATSKYRYAAVRGGRQKGALPIRFEIPSESTLPYIFHRPVTGEAVGEVALDCRRLGSSRPAKGVLALGILAFVALVGLGAVRRRKTKSEERH